MQKQDCDVSPMKEEIKLHLNRIADQIQQSLQSIDSENSCMLGELNEIMESFKRVESAAASFYLQCYLSPFTDSYGDLSRSIQHLSERRHGALIVIQRNDNLNAYIHSGIPMEATLTHALLESIFYPGNPLHDGAVLIQADRIISAANVLPVSAASYRDVKMGTRHRAAIGLSERTDALVLVVSEETGHASFAYKGTLHPLNAIHHAVR